MTEKLACLFWFVSAFVTAEAQSQNTNTESDQGSWILDSVLLLMNYVLKTLLRWQRTQKLSKCHFSGLQIGLSFNNLFFLYWLEAFISEVKWPEQFTNQASCHYCNDYYAHQEQNRHMYRVQHYHDRRKTARNTSSAAGLKLGTLCSTLHSERLFCLTFSSGWFSALVKLLIGRTPWRGRHFCGRGSNPAQSREYPSKQHRPHC